MIKKQTLNPASAPRPIGPYSQGVSVPPGKVIYVSGQVADDSEGRLVGAGDAEGQARKVFENMAAVLQEAGATMDDIVKLTIFITSRDSYPAVSKVRREFFKEDFPAVTSCVVSGLAKPEWLVEVEGIAVLR